MNLMLPPFIIEQIRQREAAERLRKDAERPRLELPLDERRPAPTPQPSMPGVERGYVVLDV